MGAGCCKSADEAVSPRSLRNKNSIHAPAGIQQQQQIHVRNINDQLPLHHHNHHHHHNIQQPNGIRKQQRTNSTSTTTATSPTISGTSLANNKNFNNNTSQNDSPEPLSINKNGVAAIPSSSNMNNNLVSHQNEKAVPVQMQDKTNIIGFDENDKVGDIKNVALTATRKNSSGIGQNKIDGGETAAAANYGNPEEVIVVAVVDKHSSKGTAHEVVVHEAGDGMLHENSENAEEADDDSDDETDKSDDDKNQFVSIVVPLADQNHLLALRRQASDFQNFSAVLQQQQQQQFGTSNNNNSNKNHENIKINYNISSTVGNDFESADLGQNNNNNIASVQQIHQHHHHSTASSGNSAEAAMTSTDETPSTLPDSQFSLGTKSDNSSASKCFFKNMSSHAVSLPLCIHNNSINNPDNPALQEAMLLAKPCSSYFRGMEGIFYCVGDTECPVVSANPCEQIWGGGVPSKQTIAICEKEISYHLANSSTNRASASHSSQQHQQQVKLEDVMSKSSREAAETALSSSNNKQQQPPNDDADEFRRATECLSPREKNSNTAAVIINSSIKTNSNTIRNNSNSPIMVTSTVATSSPTHHTDANRSPKFLFSVAAGGNGSISIPSSAGSQPQHPVTVVEESTMQPIYFVTAKRTPPDAKQSCIYTADSPPCRCARHAGVIGKYGGVFIVVSRPGQPQYQGSARRGGIVSHSHGVYDLSIEICAIGK